MQRHHILDIPHSLKMSIKIMMDILSFQKDCVDHLQYFIACTVDLMNTRFKDPIRESYIVRCHYSSRKFLNFDENLSFLGKQVQTAHK